MPNKFISNNVLRELLEKATEEERQSLTSIIDENQKKPFSAIKLQKAISREGGHGIVNMFRGQGTGYLDIVDDVASALKVHGLTPYYKVSKFDEIDLLKAAEFDEYQAQIKGIKYAEKAEEKIILKLLEKIYEKLDTKDKEAFDKQIADVTKEYGSSSSKVLTGSAGLLVLGNLGGFATYTFLTSALSTLSFGALGFGAYTAATSALSVLLGPIGWAGLGLASIFAVGKPEYKKLIPIIAIIGTIRQRIKKDLEDKKQNLKSNKQNLKSKPVELKYVEVKHQNKIKIKNKKINNDNHNPKVLVEQLKEFTTNGDLKITTHPSIEPSQYKEKINHILYAWDNLEKKFIDQGLKESIQKFLLSTNDGDGWSSKKLETWCSEHPNERLVNYPIDSDTKFYDIIDAFKKEIEICDRLISFNIFLLNISNEILNDFNRDIDEKSEEVLEDAKFFTNTQSLKKGLELIMQTIYDRRNKSNKYQIVASKKNNYYELQIIHINSFSNMSEKEIQQRISDNAGDFPLIIEKLTSICDISIETKFHEELIKIDLLGNIHKENQYTNKSVCNGFKYVLRFYR